MKILMIAPQPFFSPRGTPLSVYYRTKILSEMGHDVDILTYPIGQDVEIENVNIIRSPSLPFLYEIKIGPSLPKLLLDIPLFIKALYLLVRKKYDIVHAHEEAVFFCLLFKLFLGKSFIYDMHSSLPQQLENFNFTKLKPVVKVFDYLEDKSLRHCSAVITICQDLEDVVEKKGYIKKNELIPNTLFFPIDFYSGMHDVELDRIINTKGKKTVLYAGTFESYQGIDMYVESIGHVVRHRKDVMFIIIGGRPEQVIEMRGKAAALGISEYVVFTGTLETNIVKAFLNKTDCIVSPRLKGTNTPLKIYEYMASGVPIVATDLLTHTQELDAGCAFLRKPEPEAFADGILECLSNDADARKRAIAALDKYTRRYGKDVYRTKMIRIMDMVRGVMPGSQPA